MPKGQLAYITFIDGQVGHPDQGLPGSPDYPSQGLPGGGGGRPDQGLPAPGQPVHLPVYPFDPTRPDAGLPPFPGQGLPGGSGGRPDNSLPSVRPGKKFVAIWAACHGLILIPDNSLPGQGGTPDQELPETPEPKA